MSSNARGVFVIEPFGWLSANCTDAPRVSEPREVALLLFPRVQNTYVYFDHADCGNIDGISNLPKESRTCGIFGEREQLVRRKPGMCICVDVSTEQEPVIMAVVDGARRIV